MALSDELESLNSQYGASEGEPRDSSRAEKIATYSEITKKKWEKGVRYERPLEALKKATPEDYNRAFQAPFGFLENIPSMVGSLAVPIAQGIGAIGGSETARKFGEKTSSAVGILNPVTDIGQRVAGQMAGSLEALNDALGEAAPHIAANATPEFIWNKLSPESKTAIQASAHAAGKSVVDMLMTVGGLKGAEHGLASMKRKPETPSETPLQPKTYTNQNELFEPTKEQIPVAPEVKQQGFRNPYLLPEEERARLEAELNPPTEERIPGQGEMFTDERPYEPGELINGQPVTTTGGGPGRFKATSPESSLVNVLEAEDTRLAGATEQSNMPFGDFQRQPDMAVEGPNSTVPYKPEPFGNNFGETKPVEVSSVPFESGITPDQIAPTKYGVDNLPRETEQINRTPRTPEPPVTKGPGWTTRAGRRQRGAVDPSVFLEGIGRLVGFVPRSLEAAKAILERSIDLAKDRRDIAGRLVMQKRLDELNDHLSSTREMPKKQLSLGFGESQRGGPKFKRELPEGEDPGRVLSREEIEKIYGHELADMERKAPKDPSAQQAAREADLKLVERFKSGDQKAFSALFGKYQSRIESMLTRMLGETRAEDAFQETMRKAFSHIDNFKGQSSFYTWLFQTARNTALDEIRRYARRNEQEYDPNVHEMYAQHGETPEAAALTKERGEQINAAIEKLPDDMKNAWKLREIEELPYDDIARLLNISLSTAKMRVARARDQLAATLKEDRSKLVSGQRAKPLGQTKAGGSQRGSIDFSGLSDLFKNRSGEGGGGHMQAIKEIAKQWQLDRRKSAREVMEGFTPDNVQDISPAERVGSKGLTDKTISILTEGKKGAGDLIKWIVDQVKIIDMDRDAAIESGFKGEKFVSGEKVWNYRGFETRGWGDQGAFTEWRKMKSTEGGRQELRSMITEWLRAMEESREPNFSSERQQRAYSAIQKVLDERLEAANKARAAVGFDPIARIQSYFPALRMGDYRVVVKDTTGNTVFYKGVDTVLEAKWLNRKLKAEFPDLDIQDYHVKGGKYNLDTEALQEAMRIFGADDPAAKAIHQAYSEIVGKRGFGGQRGIKKENISGFLGSEAGMTGVRNAELALETYIRKMSNYEANLKKSALAKSVAELPLDLRNKMPNTLSLMDDFLKQARGGKLEAQFEGIDNVAKALTRFGMGIGESGSNKILSGLKSTIGAYWLFAPKFIFSQPFQHLNAMAKMVDLSQAGAKNPIAAYFDGIRNTIAPDSNAMEAVNWARRRGYLDSVLVELIGTEIGEGKNNFTSAMKAATTYTLGKVEQEFVRIPTFLMFESSLRDSITDRATRFETAAELMDHYMVNYRLSAKPMVYSHLGETLGGVAAPLKQYSHNAFGQFFEYVKNADIKDPKTLAPLVTFMGTQALVGGLKGVILFAEANAIISLINALGVTDDPIPTLDEMLMTWGASDEMVFGLASTALGRDISASVSAPSGISMWSLPPVAFTADVMASVGNWVIKKAKGTNTKYDDMRAMLATTPSAMHGAVERMFTEDGEPVVNPYTKQGNWVRSPDEWDWSVWFGGRSIDEAKANNLARYARQDILFNMQKKRETVAAIADKMTSGEEVPQALLEQYVKQGGSLSGLHNAIKSEISRRNFTYLERQQMGRASPGKARNLEIIEPQLNVAPQVQRRTQ